MGNTICLAAPVGSSRDHPHVCGEYSPISLVSSQLTVSPPRVWGIQKTNCQGVSAPRITPTCVGNTPPPPRRQYSIRDHPHVCGEYRQRGDFIDPASGSPPRVWGIQALLVANMGIIRITPTCVGNTPGEEFQWFDFWDHPHVCGEYEKLGIPAESAVGSPPRVWGIQNRRTSQNRGSRITPTCVGNTRSGRGSRPGGWDHPHVCGEYVAAHRFAHPRQGSPPRVWGIPTTPSSDSTRTGITPTCVGNTRPPRSKATRSRDHPHVCGEYSQIMEAHVFKAGSPPRVWGILRRRIGTARRSWDHPHVCGEYRSTRTATTTRIGSPPRVWGIRAGYHAAEQRPRITPTCVGNTGAESMPLYFRLDHPHVCGEY